MKKSYSRNYIDSMFGGFENSNFYFENKKIREDVFFDKLNEKLKKVQSNDNILYFFGNGASSAFANHMALDFSKNGNITARSLSDSSLLTALSNDYSFDDAMVEFLKIQKPKKNDLVITISSSGNSRNIVKVLDFCKKNSIDSLSLSGLKSDNKSIPLSKHSLHVPMKTYGMVECMHQVYLHLILDKFMNIEEWNKKDVQDMNASNFKL
ncbi:SIS domain-containing protein [Flavobacteriaceae bacterium]|nr:SIS domain-containing protein [Flavobacteriaceae bacterium]